MPFKGGTTGGLGGYFSNSVMPVPILVWFLQSGKYYSVNFPLQEGIDDESFESIFKPVVNKVGYNVDYDIL